MVCVTPVCPAQRPQAPCPAQIAGRIHSKLSTAVTSPVPRSSSPCPLLPQTPAKARRQSAGARQLALHGERPIFAVISDKDRLRTPKYLYACARGLPVLRPSWVLQSAQAGRQVGRGHAGGQAGRGGGGPSHCREPAGQADMS